MTAPGRLGPRPRRGSPPPLRFPTVPGIPSRAGSRLLGLTAERGVRGTDTDPRASFVSAPDADRQTHADKGTDRSSYGDAHGVQTRAPVYTGTHTNTQSECWWGICMCVGAGKGARPPCSQAKPPRPHSLLGPCLPSPVSTLPRPPPDAKGYLLQLLPIHYEGPLNQQGHFWGCPGMGPGGDRYPQAGSAGCRIVAVEGAGGRETPGCVRLKVSAGNKKIGVNYYSPHGFPKESGSSSLRPVFLFDGESDKWQAACSDKALLWAQPLSLKPSYYA